MFVKKGLAATSAEDIAETAAGPRRMLKMNRRVETTTSKNERLHTLGDMHGNVRMLILKAFQPRDKPTGGEGRNCGDLDARALDGLTHQIQAVPFQPIQTLTNLQRVSSAVGRKPNPISNALE